MYISEHGDTCRHTARERVRSLELELQAVVSHQVLLRTKL